MKMISFDGRPTMRRLILLLAFCSFSTAHAALTDSWFFLPSIGVGFNSAQGNSVRAGLDLGVNFDDNFYGGVGAYYAAGAHPDHDREMGVGPFAGYAYPVLSWLSLHLREDIDFVDQRTPILHSGNPDYYTHDQDSGMLSYTYAGIHLSFTRNFGISAGYRVAVGLSKSSLADGRSGTALGLTIGI
jgi:hypothetical protein